MEKARLDLAPIAQGSLSQRAYSVLRDGLISGQFRPGQRLVMQELADMLGTSITPVREACMRLVSEGGLQLRSGRFAIVPPMTLERYMEVRLMRLELEGLAAEIAAQKATPEDIANPRAIHPEYAAADDNEQPDEAFRLNRDFHFAVYRISGMEMLVSHIESLWTSMGPMLTVFFIRGNRDFLVGREYAQRAGFRILPDPAVVVLYGKPVLLMHGDLLCTDDVAYQQFRAQVRSPQWQQAFLARPLAERQAIARQMRAQSQAHQATQAAYADADAALARQWLRQADATVLIHGHTHRPADHALGPDARGRPLTQVVLSDWHIDARTQRAQVLRLDAQGLTRLPPEAA